MYGHLLRNAEFINVKLRGRLKELEGDGSLQRTNKIEGQIGQL